MRVKPFSKKQSNPAKVNVFFDAFFIGFVATKVKKNDLIVHLPVMTRFANLQRFINKSTGSELRVSGHGNWELFEGADLLFNC